MKNLKFFLLSIVFMMTGINSFAQVGFDNPNPDSSALIDMKANDKGLLVPRMTTVDRTNMTVGGKTPAHALLVFDLDQNMFFVFDTIAEPDRWVALNPFQAPSNAGDITTAGTGKVGVGVAIPSEKLDVNGNIKARGNLIGQNGNLTGSLTTGSISTGNVTSTGTVSATKFSGDGIIPKGGIIMWSGSTPPGGWTLCDGSNGSPDLRGKFIVGYNPSDADYNSAGNRSQGGTTDGRTGGEKQHTLSVSEMPSHRHSISPSSANGAYILYDGNAGSGGEGNHVRSTPTAYPMNFNSDYQGGGAPHENRPPFYTLAYIMKL